MQPGRRFLTAPILLAPRATGEYQLTGKILAANLSPPKEFSLTVQFDLIAIKMTVEELMEMPPPSLRDQLEEAEDNEDDEE